MDEDFSWKNYHRWADTLQSVGYVIVTIGPLAGIAMIIFGGLMTKIMGTVVIGASIMVCLYHLSFCLLMNAIEELKNQLLPRSRQEEHPAV